MTDFLGSRRIDILLGENTDDTLRGRRASDELYGGDGDDFLFGGRGADHLVGGLGNDVLIGGRGADTFHLNFGPDGPDGIDRIMDFKPGKDVIFIGYGDTTPHPDPNASYDAETGAVYLDAGDGPALVAILTAGLSVDPGDIVVG